MSGEVHTPMLWSKSINEAHSGLCSILLLVVLHLRLKTDPCRGFLTYAADSSAFLSPASIYHKHSTDFIMSRAGIPQSI